MPETRENWLGHVNSCVYSFRQTRAIYPVLPYSVDFNTLGEVCNPLSGVNVILFGIKNKYHVRRPWKYLSHSVYMTYFVKGNPTNRYQLNDILWPSSLACLHDNALWHTAQPRGRMLPASAEPSNPRFKCLQSYVMRQV